MDEILEFRKETLETLRGPLEDKEITISRLWASLTYPCNFMLIASMNPCPCRKWKEIQELLWKKSVISRVTADIKLNINK